MSAKQAKTANVAVIYDESRIRELFCRNLEAARDKLSELQVYCGRSPTFTLLSGWVYEQTVHYCIKRELQRLKIKAPITEQVSLGSRVKADLTVGNVVAVEIKRSGLFSPTAAAKYGEHAEAAKQKGLEYLYVSGKETYEKYRQAVRGKVGEENTFFLDPDDRDDGEWRRFIDRLVDLLKPKRRRVS
jgi:hypothetical protein